MTQILIKNYSQSSTIGARALATPIRELVDAAMAQDQEVVLDFSDIRVTQSFVDELVGSMILRNGPSILSRLVFKGCAEDVRAILRFVTADRTAQYVAAPTRPAFSGQASQHSLA